MYCLYQPAWLPGNPSVGCLIGVNPDNDNDNNALNCQQLLPYFISALPGIIRHLKYHFFFSDALLCLTSWRYYSVGFPLIYPTYRTYRVCITDIHICMCRRLDCLANTWHDLVHLVRFLWYRRIYLHIVEKKVNKRFNDITWRLSPAPNFGYAMKA